MKTIPERYFTDIFSDEGEIETIEISKAEFNAFKGTITTDTHTMFANGVDQICHTIVYDI